MAFSIPDAYFCLHNFIDTLCRNTGPWDHDRHHGNHQESHDNLHGVLHKGHHISHLHSSFIYSMGAVPDDQYGDAVHDQHHYRHHKGHTAVYKKIGLHQCPVGVFKTLFLMFLCAEGTNHIDAGKDLPCHQVQIINEILELSKLRHSNLKEQAYEKHDHDDRQSQDPGHRGVGLEYFIYASDSQDRRIENDTEDHGKKKLDLLHIVGAPGNQGCGRKMIQFSP